MPKIKDFIVKIIFRFLSSKFFADIYSDFNRHILPTFFRGKLLKCGNNVIFRTPLVIENMDKVEIGDNVSFASYIHIWGAGGVKIGGNTMIASHVAITSVDHDYRSQEAHKTAKLKPVVIGEKVWIGAHTIILPGVKIGDGAVIGANTIVNKDVPPNVIFVGSPGRIIKARFNS